MPRMGSPRFSASLRFISSTARRAVADLHAHLPATECNQGVHTVSSKVQSPRADPWLGLSTCANTSILAQDPAQAQ